MIRKKLCVLLCTARPTTFQANRSIEFTMSPSLSAVFLALNDGNAPYYNERRSNSGVFPTRGSRLLPPHTHLASATSTSSTSQPRDFIISSRPPDHRNSPLLFLISQPLGFVVLEKLFRGQESVMREVEPWAEKI